MNNVTEQIDNWDWNPHTSPPKENSFVIVRTGDNFDLRSGQVVRLGNILQLKTSNGYCTLIGQRWAYMNHWNVEYQAKVLTNSGKPNFLFTYLSFGGNGIIRVTGKGFKRRGNKRSGYWWEYFEFSPTEFIAVAKDKFVLEFGTAKINLK